MPLELQKAMIIYSNVFDYLRLQGCERIFIYILKSRSGWAGVGGGGALNSNYVELNCSWDPKTGPVSTVYCTIWHCTPFRSKKNYSCKIHMFFQSVRGLKCIYVHCKILNFGTLTEKFTTVQMKGLCIFMYYTVCLFCLQSLIDTLM